MVKSTTDKLVPASMVQNEPVFKLHRDVVDTMISGAGGFTAILHRHRGADRFRRTVLVLASCVDGTPPQSAIGAASNTGRNSPRHVVDIETVSEDGADDIVYHKRVSDNKTTYYFGQGSEVLTEYDEHGNMTKQQGKDATMGNFEQTFENTYDDNGNLVSMKSTYNGDDGYFIDYIYAALNDASYNGEGTLLFDAATDTPSAA